MGNTMDRQMSLRKKAASAMERLDVVEAQVDDMQKTLPQLAIGMNDAVNRLSGQFNDHNETLDALIGLVGVNAVQAAIQEARLNRMKTAAETTKANITKAVADGKLAKADKIGEKTLIVGRETKADGTEIPPGYAAMSFSQVKKDYKEKFLGQAAGFVFDTEAGGKFEVQELYEAVPEATPTPEAATAPAGAVTPTEATPPPADAAAQTPAPAEG